MAIVYLSSTYEDLKDYRKAVYEILRKAGHHVIGMEDYVATDQRPVDKCLSDVEHAEIYIGLFAFRYGCIPAPNHQQDQNFSSTELEYRHAGVLGKPRLTFVAKDDAIISLKYVDAVTGEGDRGERIKSLREQLLTQRLNSLFSSPHELSALVLAAVVRCLDQHKHPGKETGQIPRSPESNRWSINTQGSPYPGLMHFSGKYAPVFFGRTAELVEILDRLREPDVRFLLISGASGSGKSSLADAGVLPRIEKDGISGNKTYTCVRMVPSKGSDPFDAMLRPLHAYAQRAGIDAYESAELLVKHPEMLSQHIQNIVTKGLGTDGLVLFVDQMEELFTARDQPLSQSFLSALYQATQEDSLRVIATIRSDFLHYCHERANLLSVLNGRGHYALGSTNEESIFEMVTKPAQCAGLKISERLVQRLVKGAGWEKGSLSLLAFALQRLFDKREGEELTESAFEQLGGLSGAICRHVEGVEEKIVQLVSRDQKGVFHKLFGSLVVVTVDRTPTRRWASKVSFDARLRSVIDVLIHERLLTAEGTEEQSMICVAHEKLFDGWPTLAAWIEANREELFTLRQAEIEAGEWERHKYDLNYLWSVDRLKNLQAVIEDLDHGQVGPTLRMYAAPQDRLIEQLQDIELSHSDRLKIGQYLAALGDPRPGVGVNNGVPDIMWIDIPTGTVKLKRLDHIFQINSFRIAKYPVTNAQFQAFLSASDGYRNKELWKGINYHSVTEPTWKESNAPREMVSWYQAVAFCRWLSVKTKCRIRLPTEGEWQLAATSGISELEFPWGDKWDGTRCNGYESRLNRTTAVGMYPAGASPHGVHDMAGNLWDWCLNEYENPERTDLMRKESPKDVRLAIRGGSWDTGPVVLRTSYRGRNSIDYRGKDVGFRLIQDIEK